MSALSTDIYIKTNSKKEFFLIHGYTGNPYDFNELPEYLVKSLNANVRIITLPGHCTSIKDLDSISYNDLLDAVERELKQEIKKGKKIIIGGVSFGAQLAVYLAAKHQLAGLLVAGIPYVLKYPFNTPLANKLGIIKKYWEKPLLPYEKKLRKNKKCYSHMHINGSKIVKRANLDVGKSLNKINCPVLIIHSKHDPVGSFKGVKKIESRMPAAIKQIIIFNNINHNIFYSPNRQDVYEKIEGFFRRVFENKTVKNDAVAAIVPAYNEGKRISGVLKALTKTGIINEIIVVDDGSSDNTEEEAKSFKGVKVIKNKKNMGKSYSMDRGVNAAREPILFFCDADLSGLTPDIIEQIVLPVKTGRVDMFIGLRKNLMQKAVKLFALNSGERAMRREVWEKLPEKFKYRYRVEVGLNYIATKYGRGSGAVEFDYYQEIKEKKYGFMRGAFLRWWMNLDVGYAYLLITLDRLKIFKLRL